MDSKIVSSLNDQSNSAVECESISTDKPNATKFISTMGDFVDKQRVHEVIESQQRMLTRFEKTNEILANCNSLAVSRFEFVSKDFRAFNQQMADMKKDLDYVHRSLRIIKHKLANKHPVEYGQAKKEHTLVIPDDEEDDHRPQTTEKTVEQSDLEQSNAKSTNEQNTEPNSN